MMNNKTKTTRLKNYCQRTTANLESNFSMKTNIGIKY